MASDSEDMDMGFEGSTAPLGSDESSSDMEITLHFLVGPGTVINLNLNEDMFEPCSLENGERCQATI